MKINCKSNSEDIRIYINGVLHLRFPRDKDIKIQSWIEGHSKMYFIEIRTVNHTDYAAYDDKQIWSKVLQLLDNNI